jgi:hypothetical protein
MAWTFYNSNGEALVQNAESEATKAEMEAETAGVKFVPPDMIKYSPGVAKAYCHIAADGTLGSDPLNVDSITKPGATGRHTVVFITPFANTDYAYSDSNRGNDITIGVSGTIAVGSVQLETKNLSSALADSAQSFIAFGEQ